MHFTDEQAVDVKAWIVKKLEDISDADSDVLADYVLALLRSDAPDDEIRRNSIENLEDFLKENTEKFVNDIFSKWAPKSVSNVLPAAQIPFSHPPNTPIGLATAFPSQPAFPGAPQRPVNDGLNQSRKRSFNDGQSGAAQDSHYNRADRSLKAPRSRRGKDDRFGGRNGHAQSPLAPVGGVFPPGMPISQMSPGFPMFDPNDPMAAMMAFQAMGFPPMPGMPPLPQAAGSPPPTGRSSSGQPLPPRLKQRCKDYDTKGFCVLGSTCPYEHGNDHIVALGKTEEYDPANAMLDVRTETTNGTNKKNDPQPFRGSDRSRGRGRGRGSDRGAFTPRRNRAEFSDAGLNEDKSITTIVVEQIPEDKFDDQIVRDFFSEFGTVEDVTMQAYKRLALVKYDNYAAARRAWESPKVIFDNRFVKVYWYKPGNKDTASNGHSTPNKPTFPKQPSTLDTTSQDDDEQMFDREEFERQQAEAQKVHEEKMQQRKKMEEEKAALIVKKEEMARKHEEEKAALLAKIAAKEGKKAQPSETEESNGTTTTTEAKDNNNATTQILRSTLEKLEAEAKSLGIDPSSSTEDASTYRGRGGTRGAPFRGRGRWAPRGAGGFDPSFSSRGTFRGARGGRGNSVMRLDNRPKKVGISGIGTLDGDKDEALRRYLLNIGEYDSITPADGSVVVAFKERYQAEQLMHRKSEIPGVGKVEFAWVANTSAAPVVGPQPTTAGGGEDTLMGEGGGSSSPAVSRKENGAGGGVQQQQQQDVDYDVAEDEDWDRGVQ